MITRATLTATRQLADPLDATPVLRGDPGYPIDATDLLEFGYSPHRWRLTEPPEQKPAPSALTLVRGLWLAPEQFATAYARRPDTYNALSHQCPNCKSVSPANVCRACGRARVNVPSIKDWTGSAAYCAQWTAEQEAAGKLIIPGLKWDLAQKMTAALAADPCTLELREQSDLLCLISGTWHDDATGLDIPVHCNLDFAPKPGNTLDMALGSLTVSADADPAAWIANAYAWGMHVRAALKQALHAAATGDARATHVWAIVERELPCITARRRGAPELLQRGSDTLALLMAAYARCCATNSWPTFDVTAPGSLSAWSEVFLEPWMTQGSDGNAAYFALGAPATAA